MFSILNRALSWAITSFGNKFCLEMRSRLIKALNNRFYVKFMQLEIGLLIPISVLRLNESNYKYGKYVQGFAIYQSKFAYNVNGT